MGRIGLGLGERSDEGLYRERCVRRWQRRSKGKDGRQPLAAALVMNSSEAGTYLPTCLTHLIRLPASPA